MTHLPECFASLCECDDTHFKSIDCDFSCICPSLRACEQRVKETAIPRHRDEWIADGYHNGYEVGYEAGRDAALTLARDAVAAASARKDTSYDMRAQALAAIDALRGDA